MSGGASIAGGLSRDGRVLVGRTPSVEAFRWDAEVGVRVLALPAGASGWSIADAVSADGGVAFGRVESEGQPTRIVRWVGDGVGEILGQLPSPMSLTEARLSVVKCDAAGETLVGSLLKVESGSEQFVWTRGTGLVTPAQFLAANGIDIAGLTNIIFFGVSDDGRRFSGQATYDGAPQPILVVIPSPGTAALLLATIGVLTTRPRRATT